MIAGGTTRASTLCNGDHRDCVYNGDDILVQGRWRDYTSSLKSAGECDNGTIRASTLRSEAIRLWDMVFWVQKLVGYGNYCTLRSEAIFTFIFLSIVLYLITLLSVYRVYYLFHV